MKQADPLIVRASVGGWHHWCPACERLHPLPDSWQFNGNFARPLFTPSFKQTFVAMGAEVVGVEVVCHYFITDGMIQFCADSWHGRSDIVAMPPIPVDKGEDFS